MEAKGQIAEGWGRYSPAFEQTRDSHSTLESTVSTPDSTDEVVISGNPSCIGFDPRCATDRWSDLANAVSGDVDCTRAWAVRHPQPTAYDKICGRQRDRVDESIAGSSRATRVGGE